MDKGIPVKIKHSMKFDGRSGQVEADIQIRITGLKQGEVGKVADAVVGFVSGLKGPESKVSPEERPQTIQFTSKQRRVIEGAESEEAAWGVFQRSAGKSRRGSIRTEGEVVAYWRMLHPVSWATRFAAEAAETAKHLPGPPGELGHEPAVLGSEVMKKLPGDAPGKERVTPFSARQQEVILGAATEDEAWEQFQATCGKSCRGQEDVRALWRTLNLQPSKEVDWSRATLSEAQRNLVMKIQKEDEVWPAFHDRFKTSLRGAEEVKAIWRALHPGEPDVVSAPPPGAVAAPAAAQGEAALLGAAPEFKELDRVLIERKYGDGKPYAAVIIKIDTNSKQAKIKGIHEHSIRRWVDIALLSHDPNGSPITVESAVAAEAKGVRAGPVPNGVRQGSLVFNSKETEVIYTATSENDAVAKFRAVYGPTSTGKEGLIRAVWRVHHLAVAGPTPEVAEAAVAAVGRGESSADVVPMAPDLTGEQVTLEATAAVPPPDTGTAQNPPGEMVRECAKFSRGQPVQLKDPAKRRMTGRGVVKRLDMLSTMVMVRFRTGTKWYSPEEIEPHPVGGVEV